MSSIDWPAEARRYAIPFMLLVVVTAAALFVRGTPAGDGDRAAAKARVQLRPVAGRESRTSRPPATRYVVQTGDTLGGIAARFHTSVERLLALNPGVEPTALRVGRSVRVR